MILKIILFLFLVSGSLSEEVQSNENEEEVEQDSECGIIYNATGFIHSGKPTGRYEYPWKAVLLSRENDKTFKYKYRCGGILVDDETVLTAAHCIQPKGMENPLQTRNLKLILGAHDFYETSEVGRINVGVKEIIMHSGWNPTEKAFTHDIAILKLSDPVFFNMYVRPVCLASADLLGIKLGQTVGWGHYDRKETPSYVAKKIDIDVIDNLKCYQKENMLMQIAWPESFCGSTDDGGVCQGDSGSGFYVKKGLKYYLRGIVSSSVVRDCGDSHEALYSDVFEYLNFLSKYVSKNLKIAIDNAQPVTEPTLQFDQESCNRSPKKKLVTFADNQSIPLDGRCMVLRRKNLEWNKEKEGDFSCDFYSERKCEGDSILYEKSGDRKFGFVPKSTRCYECIDLKEIISDPPPWTPDWKEQIEFFIKDVGEKWNIEPTLEEAKTNIENIDIKMELENGEYNSKFNTNNENINFGIKLISSAGDAIATEFKNAQEAVGNELHNAGQSIAREVHNVGRMVESCCNFGGWG